MEKETKTIELPFSKKKVEIMTYIEAGLILDLPKQDNETKFLLENLIVNIDGNAENVYEQIRKLRYRDYKALDNFLTEVMKKEEGEEVKKK